MQPWYVPSGANSPTVEPNTHTHTQKFQVVSPNSTENATFNDVKVKA